MILGQLPPIGAGRPFVDIVEFLKDGAAADLPRVGPSYAELTILRRQRPGADSDEFRHDLALAQWFGGEAPSALAEEAWGQVLAGSHNETLRFEQWDSPTEVFERLRHLLVEEIDEIADIDDQAGFGKSLGGVVKGDYVYFNRSYSSNRGAGEASENWQILSPIHATAAGRSELNRSVHRHFRADLIAWAREIPRFGRKVPKPMGPEGIVYGDKVMNNRNDRRDDVYPEQSPDGSPTDGPAGFVANGEIGMVVGQFKRRGQKFKVTRLKVEFSTQLGFEYGFGRRDLPKDGGDPILELAYAITVHKSQGSEFGTTFLVIPNPCHLLSRELGAPGDAVQSAVRPCLGAEAGVVCGQRGRGGRRRCCHADRHQGRRTRWDRLGRGTGQGTRDRVTGAGTLGVRDPDISEI